MISFSRSAKVCSPRLSRMDLYDLVDHIKKDFSVSDTEPIKLSLRSNLDTVAVSEDTLDKFLSHKELPGKISRLTISCRTRLIDGPISVEIIFYDNYANLEVSGSSEGLVRGKFDQLKDFLDKKRLFFWFLKTPVAYVFSGAIYVFYFGAGGIVFFDLFVNRPISLWLLAFVLIYGAYSLVESRIPYTVIYLKEQRSFIDRYASFFTIVAFLASFITIIGFALDHFTFFK